MEELVFAIPTDKLWELIPYKEQGLTNVSASVLDKVIQYGLFRERDELEDDPSFQQIIPYAVISHKDSFYLFQRSSGQTEKRLHNKFSLGVGGHMNPGKAEVSGQEYLINQLQRELFEEVRLSGSCQVDDIDFIGFINDDTIPVGKVHVGLLYNIYVSNKGVVINEPEKMTAEWVDKSGLEAFYERMETWSRIIIDRYIRKRF